MEKKLIERKTSWIRVLLTILYVCIYGICESIILFCVIVQLVIALITKKYNQPMQDFSNKVIVYAYKILRYLSYNEKTKPFPFTDFPKVLEEPESDVE
ncbi:MAG: DUF4389 domain-containing protein [Pseudomonadota bacterium]